MFFESMNWPAFGFSVVVLALALAMAWALRRFQITDSLGFVMIVVLPLAAYGIASGYVAKISVPGGWAAEFRQVAAAQIRPAPLADEVEDLAIIEKGGLSAIQTYRDSVEIGKPIAISLSIGRQGYYSEQAIAEYIRAFLTFDPNLTVIFVENEGGRFVASANGNSVLAALQLLDYDRRFVQAIENSDVLALRRLVVLTTNSATDDTTNAEALQMMLADGVDALIKTSADGRAAGLVRRDEIVSRLMVKLAGS